MKKTLIAIATAGLLVSPLISLASASSTPSTLGNGDPQAVVQVWGLTGRQTRLVPCLMFGWLKTLCFDISNTDYFRKHSR